MKRIIYILAPAILSVPLLTGCADEGAQNAQDESTVTVDEAQNAVTSSLVKIDSEIFSLPSPIQTAILMHKKEISYREELLNPLANEKKYINQYQKSLNMGVYGADLAYLSNFNNSQKKLDYFKVVESLATDLDIRNNIDQSLIDRFAKNIDVQDSLYKLNADLFKAGDKYLKQNDEYEVATLILAGGWVEALYLAIDAAIQDDSFKTRIGEQGFAVNSLVNLLKKHDSPQTIELAGKMAELSKQFEGLVINYAYVKPITDAADKVTYLNSKSNVQISEEQLAEIARQVTEIRKSITQ